MGFSFSVQAQDLPSKLLKGKVVSASNDVTGVTIQNITTERASITDFEGNFSIRAKVGDTLVFSAVQLRTKILPITKIILESAFVQVPMEAFVNELRQVTVQPFGLSGDVEKDIVGLQLEKDVSAEALELPNAGVRIISQSERKLYTATAMGSVLAPSLDPLINLITGRTKMLKQRVAADKTYARTQAVQKSVTDSLFLHELKIPNEKINDFMYFCEVDQEFQRLVAVENQLQLWAYLLERSKLYRKNNGLE